MILVAYATKHGSTREVAEAVAATLEERTLEVEVAPAAAVRDVSGYDAVVLGGALYTGRWHRDARAFLRRHGDALEQTPVLAVFALGPRTLAPDEVASSRAQLERALAATPHVAPALVAVFGGVVDPAKLRFPFRRLPASDARDWDEIASWAAEVADVVHERVPHTMAAWPDPMLRRRAPS
jgi:menaquinone-dependent protoporphyrinogen oxidase